MIPYLSPISGRRPRVWAGAGLAVAAFGVSACGGSGSHPTAGTAAQPDPSTGSSVTATADAAAAVAAMPEAAAPTLEAAAGGVPVSAARLAGQMAAAARKAGTVTVVVVTRGSQNINGTAQLSGIGTAAGQSHLVGKASENPIDLVRDGATTYYKLQSNTARPWLKVIEGQNNVYSAAYTRAFAGVSTSTDVTAAVTVYAAMGTFRRVGQETVDGVVTSKYVTTPRPALALKLLPLGGGGSGAAAPGTKASVAIWVDAQGLLRRSTAVIAPKGLPSTQSLADYTRWGQPVSVSLPPASQVLDMSLAMPTAAVH
jgi:hypothetical protein